MRRDPREGRISIDTTRILLVFPRFNENSFWSLKDACEVWGARCPAPPLGLLTLAALLPQSWEMRLVNRNTGPLTAADLDWADLVMTGGMLPQQPDSLEVMRLCREAGVPVCVGGPDPTSNPRLYQEADFLVLGEAEGIIDAFVEAWQGGARSGRFEAAKFQADVTRSPIPRFDLLDFKDYLHIGVQFSRGCPFTCEFCDIIELYGRVPRTKTNDQMLAELDRLRELGYRGHVDFVDDNLIGNKKAVRRFLPELKAWQERHGYPFEFSTEASINMADDAELLGMMRAANFFLVFIGIESPDEATLVKAQKKQNTRRSLAESVEKIYRAGMVVAAGFIVGFDTERSGTGTLMAECIEQTSIPISMVGMLTALPTTQLTRRLEREGRLYAEYDRASTVEGDQCTAGLNFRTLRPRAEILRDYREVLVTVYRPAAFFGRVRRLTRMIDRPTFPGPPPTWRDNARLLGLLGRIFWRMSVSNPALARHFWPAFVDCVRSNPGALQVVLTNMVIYLHLWRFSRHVIRELDGKIAEAQSGAWQEPAIMPPTIMPPAIVTPSSQRPAVAAA